MTDSQDLYTYTALKIVTQAERELIRDRINQIIENRKVFKSGRCK
jgi:hypothetical protein